MSGPGEFRPDLRGQVQRSFAARVHAERFSNPEHVERAVKASRIEEKAVKIFEKAKSHYQKHRAEWIAKEFGRQKAVDAAVTKHSLSQGPRPPAGISQKAVRDQALHARAVALVDLRQQRRLHSIEKSGRRMVREIMRPRQHSRKNAQQ